MLKENITNFLIKAKQATYAGKGPESLSSRPDSHDLSYSEGELFYLDTYLGSKNFAGEEAVWDNEKPIWSMNYCGRVINSGFNSDFLKEALTIIPVDKPFRGPEIYTKDNLTYKCSVNGEIEWFNGYEEIYNKNEKVYECYFHGGKIE